MECVVRRVPMRHPGDVSGVTTLINHGVFAASDIVAILGKTEGNGCVNDFTRGYALSALSTASGAMARRGEGARRSRSARQRPIRCVPNSSAACRR